MAECCVILSGRLPGEKDDASVWAPVAAGFKLDQATFTDRVLAAVPLIVRKNLDGVAANDMVKQLRAIGVDASCHHHDSKLAYIERTGTSRGPIPYSALHSFIRFGERYRLDDSQDWLLWEEDLALDLSLMDATTTSEEEELPPPLPPEVEPPPFLPENFASSVQLNGTRKSLPGTDVAIVPLLSPDAIDVPPPLPDDQIAGRSSTTDTRERSTNGPSPNSFSNRRKRESSRSLFNGWLVAGLTALLIVVGVFAWHHFNQSNDSMDVRGRTASAKSASKPAVKAAELPRPTPSHAAVSRPSFDCEKARNYTDTAVCSDVLLGKLDVEQADLYKEATSKLDADDAQALKMEQRQWLRDRAQECGSNHACIKQKFRDRISVLTQRYNLKSGSL